MEYYAAQKVKESLGSKPCIHQHLEKEYFVGAFLINYVCTQCWKEFSIAQKRDLHAERKIKAQDLP